MKRIDLQPDHRILIIDDDPGIHTYFRDVLCPDNASNGAACELEAASFVDEPSVANQVGFELDSAFQGQAGLEMVERALAEGRPHAMAFVDLGIPPGWDGVETMVRLWEKHSELQIVVCTDRSDFSWKEMRGKVGHADSLLILKKPFHYVEVQQFARVLTMKWLLNRRAALQNAERASANESLATSGERFSKAFYESPLPSAIQSLTDQRFVDVNQALAGIAGWEREGMIGRTPLELCLWEKPELTAQWLEGVLRQERVLDQEANLRTQGGKLHEVLVSLSPVALGAKPHLLLVAQDVAERALRERQLRQAQKMEAIGQLAAGVAHDFNNILTIIQGHAGLMQQFLHGSNPHAKSLDQISQAAARAARLIRQLLMFSRKQVMQFRHLDLNDTLGNSVKMLERLVGDQVQIDFRAQPSLPALHADPNMMEQIAMNLAVNARDAMPNGGRLVISTSLAAVRRGPTVIDPEPRDGEFVCVTFSDNGTGMDAQVLTRIFEPFFTTKAVGKGTGLGLSTVFGIVRQHEGWLEVESQPNQGTSFRVYLPPSRQAAEITEPIVDTLLQRGRETILVAEDEDALREMVVQILEIQGYFVLAASSGSHALEIWERAERTIDLLVTDMVMPGGMMGGELAERLLSRSPRLKVIYTSGYSPGMAGKDVSLLAGRNFLPKPYSIGKLAKFVRECLDAPLR